MLCYTGVLLPAILQYKNICNVMLYSHYLYRIKICYMNDLGGQLKQIYHIKVTYFELSRNLFEIWKT